MNRLASTFDSICMAPRLLRRRNRTEHWSTRNEEVRRVEKRRVEEIRFE